MLRVAVQRYPALLQALEPVDRADAGLAGAPARSADAGDHLQVRVRLLHHRIGRLHHGGVAVERDGAVALELGPEEALEVRLVPDLDVAQLGQRLAAGRGEVPRVARRQGRHEVGEVGGVRSRRVDLVARGLVPAAGGPGRGVVDRDDRGDLALGQALQHQVGARPVVGRVGRVARIRRPRGGDLRPEDVVAGRGGAGVRHQVQAGGDVLDRIDRQMVVLHGRDRADRLLVVAAAAGDRADDQRDGRRDGHQTHDRASRAPHLPPRSRPGAGATLVDRPGRARRTAVPLRAAPPGPPRAPRRPPRAGGSAAGRRGCGSARRGG